MESQVVIFVFLVLFVIFVFIVSAHFRKCKNNFTKMIPVFFYAQYSFSPCNTMISSIFKSIMTEKSKFSLAFYSKIY